VLILHGRQVASSICLPQPYFEPVQFLFLNSTELSQAPVIALECSPSVRHVFHLDCVRSKLEHRWDGAAIDFAFLNCPLCSTSIRHQAFSNLMTEFNALYRKVLLKAMERLRFEGLDRDPQVKSPSGRFYQNAAGFALQHYAFYQCFQCKNPYFGGARVCQAAGEKKINREELVCVSCQKLESLETCKVHGTDWLSFKCRFCCNMGVWHCWDKCHFCDKWYGGI
jgi:E3 ubiquitin-protein ligase MYCBP2